MIKVSPSKTNQNTPKVGDILLCCTGYEASIAYWAVVVGVGAKRVQIQELEQSNVYKQGGMDWTSTVLPNNKKGPVLSRGWKDNGSGYTVKNNSYSSYYKTDRTSVECYNHH